MQNKNTLMTTIFIATVGVMMTITGTIFIIYCLVYEAKNRKRIYKEAKILAIVAIIVGLLMTTLSLLFLSKTGI